MKDQNSKKKIKKEILKKKGFTKIEVLICILGLIILELFLEANKGNGIRNCFLWTHKVVLFLILVVVKNIFKNNKELFEPRQTSDTVMQDIWKKISMFFEMARKNAWFVLFTCIFVMISVALVGAANNVGACIGNAICMWATNVEWDDMVIPSETSQEESIDMQESETFTFSEEAIETAETLEVTEIEEGWMILMLPTIDLRISEEERNILLYEDGEYKILSGDDIETAAAKVRSYINSLIMEQRLNLFDSYADEALRNKVANASRLDAVLTTSEEKDDVINTRLDAYEAYGKISLANLLSEDFNQYALTYIHYNGDRNVINLCYFHSTIWLYEKLRYKDLSLEEREKTLRSLRYRYNDIMTYSDRESEQWYRAKLLVDVFDLILNDM